MNENRLPIRFFVWWALTPAVGWAVVFGAYAEVMWAPVWVAAGLIATLLQTALWLAFSPQLAGRWLLSSLAGWLLSGLIMVSADSPLFWSSDMMMFALVMVAALPVGIAQWVAVRAELNLAALWIMTPSIAIVISLLVAIWINVQFYPVSLGQRPGNIIFGAAFGLAQGIVMVLCLRWMIYRPKLSTVQNT